MAWEQERGYKCYKGSYIHSIGICLASFFFSPFVWCFHTESFPTGLCRWKETTVFFYLTALVICPEESFPAPCWFWGDGGGFFLMRVIRFRARRWLNTIWRSWSPKGSRSSPAGHLPLCVGRRMSKPQLLEMLLLLLLLQPLTLGLLELPKSKLAAPALQQKLSALMVCDVQI